MSLTSYAALADVATPAETAQAQANADQKKADEEKKKAEEAKKKAEEGETETVVITGSRIRHDEFSSPSPVQIITRDETVLAGLSTTTEALQGSTVTGGAGQINNYFGGYVTDGGPGANTISLRGLGAVRTLVLLNGRRLAPAGSRGSVGSSDLNVLPSAMVDRTEILKDGASSVYGSDAVAGVVNIITRKGITDFTVEANKENTFDGGGNETTFSLVGGHAWDNLNIEGSVEVYDRSSLTNGQRDWAKCSTAALIDPTTGGYAAGTVLDPVTGKPKCNPISGLTGTNGVATDYTVSPLYDINTFDLFGARWTPDSTATTSLIPGWKEVSDPSLRPGTALLNNDSLISPTRNYTAYLDGSYDLHALGNAEVYFEALYTLRKSEQYGTRQLDLDYQYSFDPTNANADIYGDVRHPFVPPEFPNGENGLFTYVGSNPFGDDIESRALVAFGNDTSSQRVGFTRVVGGLRGDLPFLGDWQYDGNVTYSRADASYTFQSFLTDRIYNSLYVEPAPAGTTDPTRVGYDGVTYTCSVNVATPGTGCVPAPLMNPSFMAGNIDQAYRNYVFQNETGHTSYDELTTSITANGKIVSLPAGPLSGAVGIELRQNRINDTPSLDSINDNLYNFTSSGITIGKDAVREVFAEVEAPLLRGLPGAEDLTINVSGRLTDYNSYGADHTYKVGLSYSPLKWMKLRATKGTSYRAPALFEQFLSPTTGFLSNQVDPCYDYGDTSPPTSNRYKNCAAEGLPLNWGLSGGNGVAVSTAGGAATGLSSEHSKADTVGVVFQPSFPASVGDIALAVDWWRIRVNNQVAQIGAQNILDLCYDSAAFRAGSSYCSLSSRDVNNDLSVNDNYINIATQIAEGVDYDLRMTREIGIGESILNVHATRYLRQDSNLLPTDPLTKYNGTIEAPKWVADADLTYKWHGWSVRYGITYIGKMDSNAYLGVLPTDPFNFAVGSYSTQDVSLKYENTSDKWAVVGGIRNFTDEQPKTVTAGAYDRVGNGLLYSGYDYFGRRAFLRVTKSF